MKTRRAKKSDIRQMVSIIQQTFPADESKSAKKEIKAMFGEDFNPPTYLVTIDNKEVVAMAGYSQSWFDFSIFEIFWVAVAPNRQGQGLGQQLIEQIIEKIQNDVSQFKPTMVLLSTSSPGFFIKCGFESLAMVPGTSDTLMVFKFPVSNRSKSELSLE